MTMKKTAFVKTLQRVRGWCERMGSRQGVSLLSRCGEGENLRSCIRLPALRAGDRDISQEVRQMAKVSGTAELSVSQQLLLWGVFCFSRQIQTVKQSARIENNGV